MQTYTKYEVARIIGARALQVAMGAPILLKLKPADYERMHYSPIEIAKQEYEKDVLPITIKRPLPKKVVGKKIVANLPELA